MSCAILIKVSGIEWVEEFFDKSKAKDDFEVSKSDINLYRWLRRRLLVCYYLVGEKRDYNSIINISCIQFHLYIREQNTFCSSTSLTSS